MRPARNLPDAEIAARYAAGESVHLLALRYDCSPATIARRLRGQRTAMRPRRCRRISVDCAELERLYLHERLPLREIARRLDVSVSTMGSRRRECGIPARSTQGRLPKRLEQQRQRERNPFWLRRSG
jgi:hypothetical protein